MTGFARAQGHADGVSWTWEVKSVNAKGRDLRCRMAPGFDALEPPARDRVGKRFQRGNITLNLNVMRAQAPSGWRINHDVLDQVVAAIPEVQRRVTGVTPPSVDGLLGLRGVIEPVEEEPDEEARAALEAAILADLDAALEQLAAMRAEEGARLEPVLSGLIDEVESLQGKAKALAATQPAALKEKLLRQLEGLIEDLDPERLEQEAAILAGKADLREELDRLAAHVEAARDLLGRDGSVGRKLDFLCQEFNREANTLCSKSSDTELTRIGLDLKAAIEQFREQVQNIE